MNDIQQLKERRFVEELGIVFEQTGLPRMAGRIYGRLLISHPAYQSANELASALMASRGSISTTTRLLIQLGLIERFSLPGVRRDYFNIQSDASIKLLKHGIEEEIRMIHQLAKSGLELVQDSESRKALEDLRNMYAFFGDEFLKLMERWQQIKNNDQQVRT